MGRVAETKKRRAAAKQRGLDYCSHCEQEFPQAKMAWGPMCKECAAAKRTIRYVTKGLQGGVYAQGVARRKYQLPDEVVGMKVEPVNLPDINRLHAPPDLFTISISDLIRKYGASYQTVRRWRKEARSKMENNNGAGFAEDQPKPPKEGAK